MNQHEFAGGTFCAYCGAVKLADSATDERTCLSRRHNSALRPEPARRTEGINQFDAIRERMLELRREAAAAEPDTPAVPEYPDDSYCG